MLAPRILNDVSYVTRINHEMHFAWQAQYLVKLECDFSWQAQHLVTFWERQPEREMLYFSIQNRVQGRTSKVSEAAGARCDFLIGLSSDCRRIVVESSFYWRKQFTEFPLKS